MPSHSRSSARALFHSTAIIISGAQSQGFIQQESSSNTTSKQQLKLRDIATQQLNFNSPQAQLLNHWHWATIIHTDTHQTNDDTFLFSSSLPPPPPPPSSSLRESIADWQVAQQQRYRFFRRACLCVCVCVSVRARYIRRPTTLWSSFHRRRSVAVSCVCAREKKFQFIILSSFW